MQIYEVKIHITTKPVQPPALNYNYFVSVLNFSFYVTSGQATNPLCDHHLPSPTVDHISRF